MPVELRKRKAPQPPPAPVPVAKKASKPGKPAAATKATKATKTTKTTKATKATKATEAAKAEAEAEPEPEASPSKDEAAKEAARQDAKQDASPAAAAVTAAPAAPAGKVAVGDVVDLEGFGAQVETNDGKKTTLKKLVEESTSGVVLFTYPKASTPGCTNQACLFRDAYDALTADGLAIYGLSTDSPKANTTFKDKQKLPYPLLCDPQATLIAAIGLKKQPKGTQRGVFVVDKKGKVLVAEPGGPAATVDTVKALVQELKK